MQKNHQNSACNKLLLLLTMYFIKLPLFYLSLLTLNRWCSQIHNASARHDLHSRFIWIWFDTLQDFLERKKFEPLRMDRTYVLLLLCLLPLLSPRFLSFLWEALWFYWEPFLPGKPEDEMKSGQIQRSPNPRSKKDDKRPESYLKSRLPSSPILSKFLSVLPSLSP